MRNDVKAHSPFLVVPSLRNAASVETASYTSPHYGRGPGWARSLSVIDLLLHEGPRALALLHAGVRTDTEVAAS